MTEPTPEQRKQIEEINRLRKVSRKQLEAGYAKGLAKIEQDWRKRMIAAGLEDFIDEQASRAK